MHFAQTSAAVHFCSFTAHLYEEQISIGVIAVTQACCEPVVQSSCEQWTLHIAQTSAPMHFCWLAAHLYEEEISIGVIAETQACCAPVLQNSGGCILPCPTVRSKLTVLTAGRAQAQRL